MPISYSQQIRRKIEKLPTGAVITAELFPSSWPKNTITRILSRLSKDGLIERIKKGVYSKVTETRFGKLSASPLEVLSVEVHQDENKCFGGLFLFNNLGLTTQVPNVIVILNNKSGYTTQMGSTKIRYVRIRPRIDKKTRKYIILLEVLKNSKSIPDSSINKTYNWITKNLKKYQDKELKVLVKIAMDYPPRVRALLGNIFSHYKKTNLANQLKNTLNDNSSYRVGNIVFLLKNTKEWRLKNEAA